MEFLQFLKLVLIAFRNWMFRSQVVTAKRTDAFGFNLYECEGTPSVTPGFFIVKYRHVVNGEVHEQHRRRVTVQEWDALRAKLESAEEEPAV